MLKGDPLDICERKLVPGQWVTIDDCSAVIEVCGLAAARHAYFGRRFQISEIWWETSDGGMWWATGLQVLGEMYDNWPVRCLLGDGAGLKGLVQRYQELRL